MTGGVCAAGADAAEIDRFGNREYVVDVPYVEQAVQFEACISVER